MDDTLVTEDAREYAEEFFHVDREAMIKELTLSDSEKIAEEFCETLIQNQIP